MDLANGHSIPLFTMALFILYIYKCGGSSMYRHMDSMIHPLSDRGVD
jgi:hypothetical protein